MAEALLDFIIRLIIFNLLLGAWLAWGRHIRWSDHFHFRGRRQLR